WNLHLISGPVILKRNTKPINYNDYIMYHGTTKRKAQKIKKQGFKRSKTGMLGPGVYVSRDIRKASRYPTRAKPENRVVLELLVNVGKVKVINKQGHPMQKNWHKHGYDTAWVPPKCGMVKSGLQEDCIWDPKKIEVLDILDLIYFCIVLSVGIEHKLTVRYTNTHFRNFSI
uniref:PARP catalytic domain-containing protein n=1 Tax=Erpetoichthys calabaricus TaxID=27687 RepID=A0A8C4RMR7_ERPCA